uniref:Uncharacterized protein n=1 Tax=Schistocephalus solidus TaxID=70667 RepID=A0A0X3PLC1_SCHSO
MTVPAFFKQTLNKQLESFTSIIFKYSSCAHKTTMIAKQDTDNIRSKLTFKIRAVIKSVSTVLRSFLVSRTEESSEIKLSLLMAERKMIGRTSLRSQKQFDVGAPNESKAIKRSLLIKIKIIK